MTLVVDTSVLIDALRGHEPARYCLREAAAIERPRANEITRLEVLAGMRPHEELVTLELLDGLTWHPLDQEVAERAGDFGRRYLRGNRGIDAADLAIAATADLLGARLLTRNVKHFPMFEGLEPPY